MVEAGELSVLGTINTRSIESGIDRIVDQLKEMQIQNEQLNTSANKTSITMSGLTKTMIGFGIAGVTAITALAIKSPALAGTMAKIELETLKLSNTLGRQLKPIFDEIGQNLIPSIANAFVRGQDGMAVFTEKATLLVRALSDLISLDFKGLGINLNKIFAPEGLAPLQEGQTDESVTASDPYRETKQAFSNAVNYPAPSSLKEIFDPSYALRHGEKGAVVVINALIDTLQWMSNKANEKEVAMATANGVQR